MIGIAWFNLLLLLFLFVVGTRFLVKKSHRILPKKRLYAIVALYCFSGFISFLYLRLINVNEISKLSIKEEDVLFDESQQIQEYIFSNQIDKIDPVFVKEKKSVTTTEKELHLATTYETARGVIAYREDPTSNEIEMTVYKLLSTIDRYDVTDYLNPVNLDIVDETLYVTTQEKRLRIVELYGRVLTIEREGQNKDGFYSINGQNVVHLSVPNHIKIHIENEDFEILD